MDFSERVSNDRIKKTSYRNLDTQKSIANLFSTVSIQKNSIVHVSDIRKRVLPERDNGFGNAMFAT